jgi:hypothetical protein
MVIIQSAVKDTIGQAFWIQHFVEYVTFYLNCTHRIARIAIEIACVPYV